MAIATYLILLAIGGLLAGGSFFVMARTGNRASLTNWILASIGIGILVGATFRYFAPEILAPTVPRIEGTASGPFALSERAGDPPEALLSVDGGEPIRIVFPTDAEYSAEALVNTLAPETGGRVRLSARQGRLVFRGRTPGSTHSLHFTDFSGGAQELFGLPDGPVSGTGATSSFIRDLHGFLRTLFINVLKMMIVPIIFTSIISGMLSLGASRSIGRIGLKTLAYYATTSLLAILAGLALVNLIAPGSGAAIELDEKPSGFEETASQSTGEFLFNFFLNLVPTNPVRAMVEGEILQIIFFALLVGFFITRLEPRYKDALTEVFEGLFRTMMRVVSFVLWLAPFGVYAIFVKIIGETGIRAFSDLGFYALTVFLGLLFHATVALPLILKLVGRASPWRHFKAMSPALLTAFSTSSSSATLPLTIRCIENRAGVSNRTSSFVLPLGATVNMDGTALYECVAALFIAQIYIAQGEMPPLTAGQQFLVVFTALAASIGAAGVPMAGMVMIGIILNALGLPLEGVGYILAVDRILDMCRTTVNVWSDSIGCATIARTEGEKNVLMKWPPDDDEIPHGRDRGASPA